MSTFEAIYQQLEALGTEQNRKMYQKHGATENLFGVSFGNLKELKKQAISDKKKKGRNQEIANQLWNTQNLDAQTLACLIAEPEKMTMEDLDKWIQEVRYYLIVDYVADIAQQTPFALALLENWVKSDKEFVKRGAYTLLAYIAQKDTSVENDFFLPYIENIIKEIHTSANRAKQGMHNCLLAIGGRNEDLRERVLAADKEIGNVVIDHGDTNCKTPVIPVYLEKMYARKK